MECGENSASVKIKEELKSDYSEITPEAEAIILYPSFGAPLIVTPKQPLRLLVLFELKLFTLYQKEKDPKGKTGGKLKKTIEIINKSLKIFPWQNGKKNPRKLLFPSPAAAEGNISCHFVKDMRQWVRNGRATSPVDHRTIEDKERKLMGLLREEMIPRYFYHPKMFRFLFELEIRGLTLAEGIHDCAWNLNDPACAANSMNPPPTLAERQDLMAWDFLRQGETRRHFVKPNFKGYQIEEDFCFKPNPNLPLQTRHVISVVNKPKLNIGQLTDIHVSSRQMTFKVCEAQVLPGAEHEQSPKLGSVANVSFDTFKDLLDQMGDPKSGVDVLVLTGDLIDFNQNFDPTATGPKWKDDFKRPATMWQWMNPSLFDETGDHRPYPYFIDMVTVYSLLHDFVTTHKKPIILLNGNHEAYDKPYGISPRVFQFWGLKGQGVFPANEGIPADHNLTVYEATLLYGPAYNDYRRNHNFEAKHLDWFYTLFNPLSDFTIAHNNQQTFTALSWNDSEQFLTNAGGGMLPRANEAVSDDQLKLLEATPTDPADRILLTHFTFVSYGYEHRITETGTVNYANSINYGFTKTSHHMSHYEEGTFLTNRERVYTLLNKGAFTHALSGHSHRAGFYTITANNPITKEIAVEGRPIEEQACSPTARRGGRTCFIVGASGGPIPGQNHYDAVPELGLYKWSLERPAGNVLKLNGAQDSLCLKPTKNKKAKPRFAVALSFFNTTAVNHEKGVFQKFESGKDESAFEVVLHSALPEERFIDSVTLFTLQIASRTKPQTIKRWMPYAAHVAEDGQRKLKANIINWRSLKKWLLDRDLPEKRTFLHIAFTNKNLATKTGYKQYNYESPWVFPIRLICKQAEAYRTAAMVGAASYYGAPPIVPDVPGYRIETGEKVPDFKWYRKAFPNDYGTGEATAKPTKKKEGF